MLRGGKAGTNYHLEAVTNIATELKNANMTSKVMVDCSHGNSNKDYRKQSNVLDSVITQIKHGSQNIMGVMIESHIQAGNQKLVDDHSKLVYGKSITDACIDFETTSMLLEKLSEAVQI